MVCVFVQSLGKKYIVLFLSQICIFFVVQNTMHSLEILLCLQNMYMHAHIYFRNYFKTRKCRFENFKKFAQV
jgi:hypothetical protein